MKVRNAFLANYGEVRESLAFISGAFPEWWYLPDLQQSPHMQLIAQLQFDEDELDREFEFQLHLRRPNGSEDSLGIVKSTRERSELDPPDAPKYQIWTLQLVLRFDEAGLHVITISDSVSEGSEELAEIPVLVRTGGDVGPRRQSTLKDVSDIVLQMRDLLNIQLLEHKNDQTIWVPGFGSPETIARTNLMRRLEMSLAALGFDAASLPNTNTLLTTHLWSTSLLEAAIDEVKRRLASGQP